MSYQVSESIQNKLNTLTANGAVQKALDFMVEDHDTIVDMQCEFEKMMRGNTNGVTQ